MSTPQTGTDSSMPHADPCTIVIFGAAGDLTHRKLIPALFHLACDHCLSKSFRVVAVARHALDTESFRAQVRAGTEESREIRAFGESEWQAFAPRLEYFKADFSDTDCFRRLAERLDEIPAPIGSNRLLLARNGHKWRSIASTRGRCDV